MVRTSCFHRPICFGSFGFCFCHPSFFFSFLGLNKKLYSSVHGKGYMRDRGIAGVGLRVRGHGSEGSRARVRGIAGRSKLIRKFRTRLRKSF